MQAQQQARRIATLTSQRAAPEAENEKAIAAERQAQAEVEGRKAELARAKLNLDYATVRAPIDGVVGAALVSEGALAVQNETNLATIQQLDPIYADFTQSVTELNQLRRAFESGDLDRIEADAAKVRLVLDDNTALFARRQAAVLRRQGRRPYRPGDAARRVPQSQARTAAGHVCPRPHRSGPRQRRDRGAAAGDPAQWRRRQRGVRRQGRQPHRGAAGAHRLGAGRRLVRHRRPEGRRQGRGRRLPEVRGRRQGQAAILVRSRGEPRTTATPAS